MESKTFKQVAIGFITTVTLFTAVAPSVVGVVSADQIKQETIKQKDVKIPTPTGNEVLASDLKLSQIILIKGVAYDLQGNIVVENYGESRQKGKLSWAVKAIRAAYGKLPANVKGYIAKYAGLEAILGYIDHFTGAVEDAIYQACKYVGMPDWMAWAVSKALTLLI
jgi:hypothetical protein